MKQARNTKKTRPLLMVLHTIQFSIQIKLKYANTCQLVIIEHNLTWQQPSLLRSEVGVLDVVGPFLHNPLGIQASLKLRNKHPEFRIKIKIIWFLRKTLVQTRFPFSPNRKSRPSKTLGITV